MPLFVEYLLNEGVPPEYHFKGVLDKKAIVRYLTKIAKEHPELYPRIVKNVKKVGDVFATFEGISVGLEDISPDYAARNKLFAKADKDLSKITDERAYKMKLLEIQKDGLALGTKHRGSLQRQVESGSRGKPGQFLKTVFSPVVAKDKDNTPQPHLIRHSYSEGLTPAEHWITTGESRRELMQTQLATALPGDSSKQITNTLNNVLITKGDCGTKNGLDYSIDDHHILERYEAGTNVLVDDSYVRNLKSRGTKSIRLRSPMTCQEHPGVCQKCFGLNQNGQHQSIGVNIGLRAAHSLSEPLTQMILSSKHGGFMAKEDKPELDGAYGFRQILGIPEIFKDEAVLSSIAGKVTKIEKSPQGGHFVFVNDARHYVHPKRGTAVTVGQDMHAGDELSDGIINPKHLVALKGLGQGRKYVADELYNIYKRAGVDIDKRHIEILVKQDLNHVKVTEGDERGQFIRGDVVPYNAMRQHLEEGAQEVPLTEQVLGERLGREYGHLTTGTPITRQVYNTLKTLGAKTVTVTRKNASYEPLMRPLEQVPLLSKDWVSRMAHRRIKDTLLQGAAEGWESNTRGESPYASMIYGSPDFGKPERGHY